MSERTRKEKLVKLGVDALADCLLDIASDNDVAWNKVQRLISSKAENVSAFNSKLRHLIQNNRFVPWKYSSSFADEVQDLLEDIKKGAPNPKEGFKLVTEFFRADKHILEMVDDSSGHVGDIFRSEALELFSKFANQLENKEDVINAIVDLNGEDGYGVRDCLVTEARRFLSMAELRNLFKAIEKRAKEKNNGSLSWELSSIAKQMNDGPLFERLTREKLGNKINSRFIVEMAEVYFGGRDIKKATDLLSEIAVDDHFADVERMDLQKKILKATQKTEELIDLLTK